MPRSPQDDRVKTSSLPPRVLLGETRRKEPLHSPGGAPSQPITVGYQLHGER